MAIKKSFCKIKSKRKQKSTNKLKQQEEKSIYRKTFKNSETQQKNF